MEREPLTWMRRSRISRAIIAISMAIAVFPMFASVPTSASTPGKNGRIVFAGETSTSSQIFSIKDNGTDLWQLTNVNGWATTPDWSPDGLRIAFELDDDTHAGIAVMNANGSNLHDLTPTGLQSQPTFTPDGRHLVYECASCTGGDGIFLMRDDGSDYPGLRLSTNPFPEGWDANAEVSPNGRTVTFVRIQAPEQLQAIFAVNIDGTNTRQLTPYELEVGIKHDWAPDGSHIVVTVHADFPNQQSANVATIKPDGSDLKMLTNFAGEPVGAFAGSYSPDGHWVVYRLQGQAEGVFELWVVSPDGHGRRMLGTFPFSPRFIDWGPRTTQDAEVDKP